MPKRDVSIKERLPKRAMSIPTTKWVLMGLSEPQMIIIMINLRNNLNVTKYRLHLYLHGDKTFKKFLI